MRWITIGVAILVGVMGLATVALAGNRGLSPIIVMTVSAAKQRASMRWIASGVAALAGVMGMATVAMAGNRGLSPIISTKPAGGQRGIGSIRVGCE